MLYPMFLNADHPCPEIEDKLLQKLQQKIVQYVIGKKVELVTFK